MRFLLLAALCLFAAPAQAETFLVPNNGIVAVYGDFADYGGYVSASFSYTETGGSFSQYSAFFDAATYEEVDIRITVNNFGSIISYDCNQLEAHCGRGDKSTPNFVVLWSTR